MYTYQLRDNEWQTERNSEKTSDFDVVDTFQDIQEPLVMRDDIEN